MSIKEWTARIVLLFALIWWLGDVQLSDQATDFHKAFAGEDSPIVSLVTVRQPQSIHLPGEASQNRSLPFVANQHHSSPVMANQLPVLPLYLPMLSRSDGTASPSNWIDPAEGGTVTSDDGSLTLTIPPGAFSRRTEVEITTTAALPPAAVSDLGLMLDISARDDRGQTVTALAVPATLAFRYGEANMAYITSPAEYVVYAQGADNTWTALSTTVDTDARVAQAQTDHFSHFGLFAPALSGRLGGPYVGDVAATISDYFPVSSMGMDHAGNFYFLHGAHYIIYRRPPSAGREVLFEHFDVRKVYEGTDTSHGIDVDPETGVIYLLRDRRVFRIDLNGAWRQLYPASGDDECRISQMSFDDNTGTVWVTAACGLGQDTIWTYDQIRADNGRLMRQLPGEAADGGGLPISDSQGRLFARGEPVDEKTSSLVMWDEEWVAWRPVAQGFLGGGGLTADSQGNIYVASGDLNAISVISGEEPFVTGVIWTDRRPRSLRHVQGRLLMSSGGAISTLPTTRRDPLDGNANGLVTEYTGTVSGNGSWVTLTGNLSAIPAHHAVWVGDVRLRLVSHSPDQLRFLVPYYDRTTYYPSWQRVTSEDDGLPYVGPEVRLTFPSGEMTLHVGRQQRSLGQLQTPELGRFRPHRNSFSSGTRDCTEAPLEITQGEWVIWWTNQEDAHTVIPASEGFKAWSSETGGPWVAHQFPERGEFTFLMSGSSWGVDTLCTIRVTEHGESLYNRAYQVHPAIGGTYYHNGVRVEIPAGALPGTESYTLTMRTRDDNPPTSVTPHLEAVGYRRTFEFQPEPDRLLQDIRISMPRGTRTDYPAPAFYDNALDDAIAAPYRRRTYIPLEHTVTEEYVHLMLAAGDYLGFSEVAEAGVAADWDVSTEPKPKPSWGQRLKARVNDIGSNIWWKVGLPNEKLENEWFTITYNTHDGTSGEQAFIVLQSLNKTRRHFHSKGYTVPRGVIVTLHQDTTIEGSASGLGRAMHWKMTVGAWQAEDDMRSAAAHELFHIIQYENMSYAARALKGMWGWWMEGTAVWAETQIYPKQNTAAEWVQAGSDFIHVGMDNYGSLSDEQQYATVALITFLENRHPGAVLHVLKELGVMAGPQLAISELTGGLTGLFMDFALAYLSQAEEPYKSWDLSKAILPVALGTDMTTLVNLNSVPGRSARGFLIVANTGDVPISFSEAEGSVLFARFTDGIQFVRATDGSNVQHAHVSGLHGNTHPETGAPLPKAESFTAANPLRVIYANYGKGDARAQIHLDVPSLYSASPLTFEIERPISLRGNGFGFGSQSTFELNGVKHEPDGRSISFIYKNFHAGTFSPGSITVRVCHAAGVCSNPQVVIAE